MTRDSEIELGKTRTPSCYYNLNTSYKEEIKAMKAGLKTRQWQTQNAASKNSKYRLETENDSD